MMEGAYNKVLRARAEVPSETYTFFMDTLMETVRDEIADCIEKAYGSLSLSEAQKLLGILNSNDVLSYAKEVCT
jgi:26S proteasome regulatory subunit N12